MRDQERTEVEHDSRHGGPPLALSVRGIAKTYGGTRALAGCDLEIRRGEVHGLVGANGAGKSTLVKVISGAVTPDGGVLTVGDRWSGEALNPRQSQAFGIATIYQDPDLVPEFDVAQNVALGHEPSRWGGFQSRAQEARAAADVMAQVGLDVPVRGRRAELMSRAQQQLVEIAKALHRDAKVIMMDEPTAPLGPDDTQRLEAVIRGVSAHGVAILYISHRLPELMRVCDRITVMREGRHVDTHAVHEVNEQQIVEAMTGGRHAARVTKAPKLGPELLRLEGVGQGTRLRDVSLSVRTGEVVVLAGLVGAGRSRLLRLVLGEEPMTDGRMFVDGEPYAPSGAVEALRRRVALVPEGRKTHGLFMERDITENIMFVRGATGGMGFLRRRAEARETQRWMEQLNIVPPNPRRRVNTLSGGNQQKVLMARWLRAGVRLLLIDEATEGVDVSARAEIVRIVRQMAGSGAGVLASASESEELFAMADRIVVMRKGAIVGEVSPHETDEEEIMTLASGLTRARA